MLRPLLLSLLLAPFLASSALAGETRTTYNASGQPVAEMVFDGDRLASETAWTYDGSVAVKKVTTAGESVTETAWTYDGGDLIEEVVTVDGQRTSLTVMAYDGGKLVKKTVVTPAGSTVTTTAYDSKGRVSSTETRDGAGGVVGSSSADYGAARVPIVVAASAGGAYASDVSLTTLAFGFAVDRSPDPTMYDEDPLEVSAFANYAYGLSKEVVVQNQLDAGFGMDLNHLLGKWTYFLFTTVERDQVTNLNLDLIAAPVGVKYDIIEGASVSSDISFAPVWNYRSITALETDCDGEAAETDTVCSSSKIRGSLRYKLKFTLGPVSFSDTLEYLPNLAPEDESFFWALSNDSILINTASLGVKLSDKVSLAETFVFERDPTLAAQADCVGDPDNLLCDGLLFSTTTTLTFAQTF